MPGKAFVRVGVLLGTCASAAIALGLAYPLSQRASPGPEAVGTSMAPTTEAGPEVPSRQGLTGPSFDIVRVDRYGEVVAAGRAAPGDAVSLLLDGKPYDTATADASGEFTFLPPALAAGSHELSLLAVDALTGLETGGASVSVHVAEDERTALVLQTAAGAATRILSGPDMPMGTMTGVSIASVESEPGGRLYVSGTAPPGSLVRFTLNDAVIAHAETDADGGVSFRIDGGIEPGEYVVGLSLVVDGTALPGSLARVVFVFPAVSREGLGRDPATATVGSVRSTVVMRGDTLWEISRRVYGSGTRYTVIYGANADSIADPDLIYPGQGVIIPQ